MTAYLHMFLDAAPMAAIALTRCPLLRQVRAEDAPGHPVRRAVRPSGEHAGAQRGDTGCQQQRARDRVYGALANVLLTLAGPVVVLITS